MLPLLLYTLGWIGLVIAIPTSPRPLHPTRVTRQATNNTCPGYAVSNVETTDSSLTADLKLAGLACNLYSPDLQDLKLLVEYQSDERLHVKIYDAGLNVYQVQENVFPRPKSEGSSSSSAALAFNYTENPFSFTVTRKENNEVLFDTSGTPLIFESQYVRLRTSLPENPNLYGLGEHSDSFRLTTQNYIRTLWNSENPSIPQNQPLYGSHPVYFEHRGDKGTHGVFLLNANGMDIKINSDAQGQFLEYNTIGGVLDFYFLAGSKPADVSRQYADVAGYSAMYPYWTFGFQQCKYGYWDVNMVAEVVGNYSTAGIPLEVMWTDINYMDLRQDFTVDEARFPLVKMRELVDTLHKHDQKYVLILDPGVHAVSNYETYSSGHSQDVFLKNADGSDYIGVQWPGVVAWPDWFAPNTLTWWTNEINNFFNADTGIDIDGLWVDMNEGSNFCPDITCQPSAYASMNNVPPTPTNSPRPNTGRVIPGFPDDFQPSPSSRKFKPRAEELGVQARAAPVFGQSKGTISRPNLFEPPYAIHGKYAHISDKTIWVNTTNYDGTLQYDTHNLYGYMMADASHSAMLKRRDSVRPVVMTRSTFAGIGSKVTHWFGDNASIWEHYRTSIRQMLSFVAMHQMPMVGSDVCGFNQNAEEGMCARWAMIGAFQPFYRNHAADDAIFQEFYRWESVATAAKKAIDTRYKLIDYAYTGLYYQTKEGTPWINPLFYLYPSDPATFGIEHQWFYGDALLISPVVNDDSSDVDFYLPKDIWYDYWTHARIDSPGQMVHRSNLSTSEIPVHIRGGTIIPQRANSANTTTLLRKEDFVVIVAPGADGKASGRLYLDDGNSIDQPSISEINFSWDGSKLSVGGSFDYSGSNGESTTVSKVVVLGKGETEGSWNLSGDTSIAVGS